MLACVVGREGRHARDAVAGAARALRVLAPWRRRIAREDQPFSTASGTGTARPHQLGCGLVSTTTAAGRPSGARVVRGGDRVRHRSAYRGPDGPAGAGDAAGRRRQRNRSAALELPLWARTIRRAVGHERLLAIKALLSWQPTISVDIRNLILHRLAGAAVMQGPLLPADCGALWGSWTGQAPPVLCRAPALPVISAGERANGVSARGGQGQGRTADLPLFRGPVTLRAFTR